ncbi:(2Fe-2S)-binding protein [Serratia surfactantfaciens]|uniref:(2Fe-2S)-binding protein n=1 Tax=Serratia surfactantfaciens TaxID=2741499 RepID=UPI0018E45D1B|nr:(2Fe-2S)-binding protein [Serratia surfactantfaciens]MBI6150536.1 (2Fe-2S)-binding protein [Serratia surfactantfaciens]
MNERQNTLMLSIDGEPCRVPVGISVAAALSLCGTDRCRLSVSRQPRAPFCGMGVCQECRVTINGLRRLACQTLCQSGMSIERSDDE